MIKHIIFDLDGTLIDSKVDIANAVRATLKKLQLQDITPEQIYECVGHGVEHLIRDAINLAHGNMDYLPEALTLFRKIYFETLLDNTVYYNGVTEGLEKVKHIQKTVYSNKMEHCVKKIIEGLSNENPFLYLCGGDTFKNKKPNPEGIYFLLKNTETKPEETIIIGDSAIDIQTGKNAGILTCGVTYGYRSATEIVDANPDFIAHSFSEVINIILERR